MKKSTDSVSGQSWDTSSGVPFECHCAEYFHSGFYCAHVLENMIKENQLSLRKINESNQLQQKRSLIRDEEGDGPGGAEQDRERSEGEKKRKRTSAAAADHLILDNFRGDVEGVLAPVPLPYQHLESQLVFSGFGGGEGGSGEHVVGGIVV